KISQASVTNMVQRLDGGGLLKYEKYRGLVLTTAGETLARNITRRHQLRTDFLTLLRLDKHVIHHDVEGMEPPIRPPTLRAIAALTAQLKRRPALLAQLKLVDRAAVLVLALDIGSSSTRSALCNERGRSRRGTDARRQYSLRYTADGGAELSPLGLRRAVQACLRETLAASRRKIPIGAVGGSAFWHGLLGLDRKGRPLTPIFTWADSRCATDASRLREEFDERKTHGQTGCMLRASFWPAKLRWLRRTNRRLFRKVNRWVSPADWIFEEIFGAAGTSHSMASATGLYDRRTKSWHAELCDACGVDPGKLGEVQESSRATASGFSQLKNAEIFAAIGDGAAGNLGSDADRRGRIAINVGTSAAVRMLEHNRQHLRPIPFGL